MTLPIYRVSETYGAPTLVNGQPQSWLPSSTVTESWGTLRIEFGGTHIEGTTAVAGTDVSTVRGARTLITALSFGEPGGEGPGSLTFPAITPFDELDSAFPWTKKGTRVDVWRVKPDTSEVPYWCGRVGTRRDASALGLVLQVVGAFTGETNARMHQPWFLDEEIDIGSALARDLDPTTHSRPLPGYGFVYESAPTGIKTRKRGSRGQTVLDFANEMLTMAQDTGGQWTISRAYSGDTPQSRKYYLRHKGDNLQTSLVAETSASSFSTSLLGGYYPANPPTYSGTGGYDATFSLSTTHAHTSSQSLKIIYPSQGGTGWSSVVGIDYGALYTPTDGVNYTLGLWVWLASGGSSVVISSGEADRLHTQSSATVATTGVWEYVEVTAVGVETASWIAIELLDPTLPTTVYVDGASITQGHIIQINTVSTNARGVTHELVDDALESPNVIYGEGVDPSDGSHWRNAKFPGLYPRSVPTFPGALHFGDTDPVYGANWISRVQASMRADGYPDVTITGEYDFDTCTAVGQVQLDAGLTIANATINSATWTAIWTNVTTTEFGQSYFRPLAWDEAVEPYLYYSDGSYRGPNTGVYDPNKMRVEVMQSFGEACKKGTAQANSGHQIERETLFGPWAGTITLDGVSPEERSAFDIREGSMLRLRYYRGSGSDGTPFFVAGVSVNPETQTVTLTVDQKPYDILALAAKIARNKEARLDPARDLFSLRNRSSKMMQDSIGWDKESGAGVVPKTSLASSGWHVIRMVGCQIGSVAAVKASISPAGRFAMALFGAEVTTSDLAGWVPSPLAENTTHSGLSWWSEAAIQDDLTAHGFIDAWGEYTDACGYAPSKESVDPTPSATGKMEDSQPLSVASLDPPFFYLGVWTEDASRDFDCQMRVVITDEG